MFIQKADKSNIKKASIISFNSVKGAALALIPTLAMVQIFSNSGIASSQYDSALAMIIIGLFFCIRYFMCSNDLIWVGRYESIGPRDITSTNY